MPIGFARFEFVKRSSGKNACAKSAYNSRSKIHFSGNEIQKPQTFDWSKNVPPVYHKILLPNGVDSKYKSPEVLWNTAEKTEVRVNSQTAFEMVLALPDDKVISIEDREILTSSFVEKYFVQNGLGTQIDIHAPDKKQIHSKENNELEEADHNWHAHILITTRRFDKNGKGFEKHKARDLMPTMRGGKVISGPNWGKIWTQHQNAFFEKKGLALRVEPQGIVSQIHLGPVRMRGRAFSLLHENNLRMELNDLESEEPGKILEKITETKSLFSPEDVLSYLYKHVSPDRFLLIKEAFWKQGEIVQLIDPKTKKVCNKFTTKNILNEEKQIQRLGDRLFSNKSFRVKSKKIEKFSLELNSEQKKAFQSIIVGQGLSCIDGHAGTGKSHLLFALKNFYESQRCVVRGFGPDNASADVLKSRGFIRSENIYRFLFALKNGKRNVHSRKEVWILDEAGKLGTKPFLELLKHANKHGAQVILSGDISQLPSVERGGIFKVFCEKYGSLSLENIQRQKEEFQREVAKKLACGKMGQALDAITRGGGIKWAETKEQSLEELVKEWIHDRRSKPNESHLVIAHSNKEVRALNELIRLYRKEIGELKGKEYLCETVFGKLYISEGDRVEFRRNNGSLGVSNGMQGVLIKASKNKFTVQLKEENRTRHISFNPNSYRSFQLGYATTYYRSQGRTVDRAYVLHSPMMNKEMFYVGLTRHSKKSVFYISNEDAANLSDLKAQAYRSEVKVSTLEYLSQGEIDKRKSELVRNKQVQEMKSSSQMMSKLKGFGISAWEGMKSKVQQEVEGYKDVRPNKEFFDYKPVEEKKGLQKTKIVDDLKFKEESFDIERQKEKVHKTLKTKSFDNVKAKEQVPHIDKVAWKQLSEEKQKLLRSYYTSLEKALSLHLVVKSESEVGEGRRSHVVDWQKTCSQRDALAYKVLKSFNKKELRVVSSSQSFEALQERAEKHQKTLNQKIQPQTDYDKELKNNLEGLLYRLFPEGPVRRDKKGFRFGAKGSLAVTCQGSKFGSFYDFENQEGGGPLQLIQKCLSCSHREAVNWAKGFLGKEEIVDLPSHFVFKGKEEQEQEWISIKPDLNIPAPSLKELSRGLSYHYKEVDRYAYRGKEGSLLFYIMRLEDRKEEGKKIILPLSYGYCNGSDEVAHWSLKGFQSESKPLYHLHLLKEHPNAKVLIVEGEKAADAATKLFPKERVICLTWSGGASAVSKSDWSPLAGRQVIIWPDNDKAGYAAANSICSKLKWEGVKSLQLIDKEVLTQTFPLKWDLADLLPKGITIDNLKDFILRAKEQKIVHPEIEGAKEVTSISMDHERSLAESKIQDIDF